jgi:predicted acylesterase/phospholipase RssA
MYNHVACSKEASADQGHGRREVSIDVKTEKKKTDHTSIAPVERIATDPDKDSPKTGLALCLSGGGYRAMVFHAGVLWRLYELGILNKVKRISSVSGGSITAGILGLNWKKLSFDRRPCAMTSCRT